VETEVGLELAVENDSLGLIPSMDFLEKFANFDPTFELHRYESVALTGRSCCSYRFLIQKSYGVLRVFLFFQVASQS